MKLKELLEKYRAEIKALADKDDLTPEETKELEGLLVKAESTQARIKAQESLSGPDGKALVEDPVGSIKAQILAEIRAEAEAEAEQAANIKALEEAAAKKAIEEHEANAPRWGKTFNTQTVSDPGTDEGGMKAWRHYLRSGDGVPYDRVYSEAAKAALQGQTDDEGGYLVPDDFFNSVVAKRDDMSVVRRAGAQVIQTSLDRVLIPTENSSMSKFAITAEEAAVDEDEPTFGQSIATVHKATKLVKVSEELLSDNAANLDGFLSSAFGRAEAEWENYYLVSTGSGSSQPKAALIHSTVVNTAAGTNAITAAEMNTLIYGLGGPYASSPSVALVARRATIGAIFALTGSNFMFQGTPAGAAEGAGDQFSRRIEGIPFYADETMPAFTTGNKVILLCDFSYYFVVERMGLVVQRLDELYAGNGQIGLLAKFRRGGVPTQAEAFKHLITT